MPCFFCSENFNFSGAKTIYLCVRLIQFSQGQYRAFSRNRGQLFHYNIYLQESDSLSGVLPTVEHTAVQYFTALLYTELHHKVP